MTPATPSPIKTFKRILVPVSNPNSAAQMLELATKLIEPEAGKVIAVLVGIQTEGEKTQKRLESLAPVLKQFEEDIQVETYLSSSVTRGILDSAREFGAEAIMLGVQQSETQSVQLGAIVQNVIHSATCNVLIYRMGNRSDFERLVVPLDDHPMTPLALQLGVTLAQKCQVTINTPIIQRDYNSSHEREAQWQGILAPLAPEQVEERRIIKGRHPAEHLLRKISERDLLLLGFSQELNLDYELGRNLSDILINHADAPVLLYSQILDERDTFAGLIQRQLQRFQPRLTEFEQDELAWSASKNAAPSLDFNMLILMSAALASLGLLANSTAVIIGAMLVAPLMSPLGSLAYGLTAGDIHISRQALLSLVQGVVLALLISMGMGLLIPSAQPTPEMLARGNPSLLDAGVALVSGLVAAFALARKEIPVALAGVAIAAALMPPVCTIGLGIAFRNPALASGAALLFLVNICFIVAAQTLILLWLGLRPKRRERVYLGFAWVVLSLSLILSFSLLLRLGQSAERVQYLQSLVVAEIQMIQPDASISNLRLQENAHQLNLQANLRSRRVPSMGELAQIESNLSEQLGQVVDLNFVLELVISAEN